MRSGKITGDVLPRAFHEVLKRPWFRRVWILQEVANARTALVHCGSKSVSATIFALCPTLLRVSPNPHCQAVLDVMPGPSRRDSWWFQNSNFYTLLKKFSKAEAERDHDRIFALLGLCPQANEKIMVNYETPTLQLLQDVMSYVFKADSSPYDFGSLSGMQYNTIYEFMDDVDALHSRVLERLLLSHPAQVVDDFLHQFLGHLVITTDLYTAAMTTENRGEALVTSIFHQNPQTPQIQDQQGITPLMLAATYENRVTMRLFIEHGADCKDSKGFIPLCKASELGDEALVRLLLDRGASCEHVGVLRPPPKRGSKSRQRSKSIPWPTTTVPSTSLERFEIFADDKDLVSCGPARHPRNTAYQEEYLPPRKAFPTVSPLSPKCDIFANNAISIRDDLTVRPPKTTYPPYIDPQDGHYLSGAPLRLASTYGHEGIARLLVDHCTISNLNAAFETALQNGNEAIARLLLDRGATASEYEWFHAIDNGNEAIIRLFLEGRMSQQEPLEAACKRSNETIVRLLLDHGAKLETRNDFGQTLLSLASRRGEKDRVKTLLAAGADWSIRDIWGRTPLGAALFAGHNDVVQLLRSKGAPE